MRRGIVYLAIGGLTLGILALGGIGFLYSWKVKPSIDEGRKIQEKYLSLYREDTDFLAKIGLIPQPRTAKSDASSFLNGRVFWAPHAAGMLGAKTPLVPMDVREELLRMKNEWIQQASKSRRMTADLSMFSGLNRFDHWDVETGESPIRLLTNKAEFVPPPRLPIPEPGDLIAAAKLRLMKATLSGDLLGALADTRQLGRLLLTTENLQLVLAGLAILDHERRAYRHFVDDHGLPAELWQPIDRNTTRRANRAVLATRGYLRLWTKPEILEQIFLGPEIPPGFCAAVNEAFPLENSLRGLLQPKWPLEMDFRDAYERLDKVFAKARKSCRLRYLNRLTETDRFATAYPGPFLLNRLPYSRKIFGMRLSSVSVGGFDSYSQRPSAASGN